MLKTCRDCNLTKDEASFSWRSQHRGIRQSRCKSCMSLRMRTNRYEITAKYGLTRADYEKLLKAQNGVCFICKLPETVTHHGKVIHLAVDHDRSCCPDHRKTCGKCIRALLCADCNRLVGRFEANPEKIQGIINYLSTVGKGSTLANWP